MMKIPVLLTAFFSALILFSCEKKEPEIVQYFEDSLSIDLYPMLFASGSQWVYQDSAGKTLDTVTFIEVTRDTNHYVSTGLEYSSVCYSVDAKSSVSGNFKWFYIGYIISVNDESHDYIYLAGKRKNDSVQNAVLEKVFDTLIVNNIKYPDVVKMRIKSDDLIQKPMILYFTDSIGIVRKEVQNNSGIKEVWNLIYKDVTLLSKE